MTWHLLYLWPSIHCIWHLTHELWYHKTLSVTSVYLISNWLYLTAHQLYLCHHTEIIDHITPIVCMITRAQYIWHHTNTYGITSTHYDITQRYDLHTHCIHVITPRIPVIASTAAELLLTVYWVYHICNMCDLKPTICMASNEFYVTSEQLVKISQECIHDITATLFMTSHTLYLWPHSPVTIKRLLLCFWHYTQCIWHLTWWMNDNTTTVSDMIPNVSV